jgi:large subunit ribosomal protein L16
MAQPSRLIYRKPHLTSCSGKAKGCKKVDFGEFGLMCINGKGMTKDLQQRTGN